MKRMRLPSEDIKLNLLTKIDIEENRLSGKFLLLHYSI